MRTRKLQQLTPGCHANRDANRGKVALTANKLIPIAPGAVGYMRKRLFVLHNHSFAPGKTEDVKTWGKKNFVSPAVTFFLDGRLTE